MSSLAVSPFHIYLHFIGITCELVGIINFGRPSPNHYLQPAVLGLGSSTVLLNSYSEFARATFVMKLLTCR